MRILGGIGLDLLVLMACEQPHPEQHTVQCLTLPVKRLSLGATVRKDILFTLAFEWLTAAAIVGDHQQVDDRSGQGDAL